MSFKDLIKKDVQKIFMNPDEFSEIHNINGKDMPIQIDANEQIEREKRQNQNSSGIYVNWFMFLRRITENYPNKALELSWMDICTW